VTETRVIRYRTKPECADDNARLIEAVFDDLIQREVTGIRYTAFRLDDGVTFLHVAVLDGEANPLEASPPFAAFQAGMARPGEPTGQIAPGQAEDPPDV
jgi:hypothetical protein